MKTKFIQILAALILPISFIIILILLNAFPLVSISKYGLGGILMTGIALLLTYAAVKRDNTSFKKIGFQLERKTPFRFITGFIIGLVVTIVILAIVINFSSLQISYNDEAHIPAVLFWLFMFFPLAYMEEIIFRGYAFTKINKKFGIWTAQILLSLLFIWYHDFTGATFYYQLLGPGIWAFIYGIAAVWSKGIAFPTGLHMAINVVLALVGQKDERHGLWNLEYPIDVTSALKIQTENIGLFSQLCVLIIAIILTEYYRRNILKIAK